MSYAPILIADDDENEVLLLKRAFAAAQIANPLVFVPNGEAAIQYLSGMGAQAQTQPALPILLLLDLKMPRMDGLEVLRWVRARKPLNRLVVVILSSSADPRDVNAAYDLHANSYLVKRSSFDQMVELLKGLHNYWFCWNERPDCSVEADTLRNLKME